MNRVLIILCVITLKAGAQTSAFQLADSLFNVGDYKKAIELYQSEKKFLQHIIKK
ncbi:hypothetical protein [Mesonia aestuariivivens]|uniref:Tetratricopeptide repeat protein n=1 Tax=Mesonia aestuariivivens TaxID=2796128 RepID=A0ABS6W323_9FLAO|nr:hypothetical protein [Mesonia aestuariivivens]MBW2962250.1 hypothetical protein [Mesonia aestuariivivens]